MTLRTLICTTAMAGALASPAAAQDYCGGIGNGQWIGGNEANSDIAASDSFREQLALVLLGNAHTSLFTLSSPAEVRLEAAGRGSGDPVIEILDGSGAVIGSDDDSGGGTSSAALLALQPGTYCVQTTSWDNSPLTATVRVGRTEHEALTEGGAALAAGSAGTATTTDTTTDTASDAGTMDAVTDTEACGGARMIGSGPIDGSLDAGISVTETINATPNWAFELSQPAALSITAENEAADPVLTLTGADGSFYAENDDYDGLNSRIDMTTPLQPGTYCVGLRALSDGGVPVTVTLSAFDPEAATRALYERGEVAPPLDGSFPITDLGTVSARSVSQVQMQGDTAQWFRIEVAETGLLLIEGIAASSGDPVLRLFDDVGREVGYNDDYGQGLDSQIAARVFPGTYLVALMDISGQSPLLRLVMERYVPAQ
ncbi:DVUA0089 family protein [Histidinibacterium lentulum]|uniref:ABC transporter substrate-binding protein n=1 Tax=Histidinibacterium lentulum TaxID=2480588 RepID=A0A3N2R600_9RHOB|nr:DVUA0089 family protein [Histidinibacterium lentulum]ROU02828.1 ABC transporter substrate-binding protein [Histidinibacterium lentulum]